MALNGTQPGLGRLVLTREAGWDFGLKSRVHRQGVGVKLARTNRTGRNAPSRRAQGGARLTAMKAVRLDRDRDCHGLRRRSGDAIAEGGENAEFSSLKPNPERRAGQ